MLKCQVLKCFSMSRKVNGLEGRLMEPSSIYSSNITWMETEIREYRLITIKSN